MTKPLCYIPVGNYTIKGEAMAATDEWNKMTQKLDPSLGDWVPAVQAYPERMPDGKEWPALQINTVGQAGGYYALSIKMLGIETAMDAFFDMFFGDVLIPTAHFAGPTKELFGFDDKKGYARNYLLTQIVAQLEKNDFNKIELLHDKGRITVGGSVPPQRKPRLVPHW